MKLNLKISEIEFILIELLNKKINLSREKEKNKFTFSKIKESELNETNELLKHVFKQVQKSR